MYGETAQNTNVDHPKNGSLSQPIRKQHANCPSCGHTSTFTPAGVQNVPKAIAAAASLPQVIRLYHCDTCKSTVSDQDLMF